MNRQQSESSTKGVIHRQSSELSLKGGILRQQSESSLARHAESVELLKAASASFPMFTVLGEAQKSHSLSLFSVLPERRVLYR